METRLRILAVLLAAFFVACSDDPSQPEQDEGTSFNRMIGGPGQEAATEVVVTSDGRRVVMGSFSDTLRVTNMAGFLVPFGSHDIFVASFLEDGTPAGMKSIGGTGFELAASMSRDTNDDVYIAGYYSGPSSIGALPLPVYSGADAFVARVDPNSGAATWLEHGGGAGNDAVLDIEPAGDGTVYFCGIAAGEFSIAGEDVGTLGGASAFVVHVTPGAGGASQIIDGAGAAQLQTLALAAVENGVYLCGSYRGGGIAIDGTNLANDGGLDGFVARFDENFNGDGVVHIGGTGEANVEAITALGNAAVITGWFLGTVDFDPSTNAGEVTSQPNSSDAFVVCYNSDGSLRWLKVFASSEAESGNRLALAGNGRLLLAGVFENQLLLGSFTVRSAGGSDQFVATLDSGGNVRTAFRVGGPENDFVVCIAAAGDLPVVAGGIDEEGHFPDGSIRRTFGQGDAFIYQR